MNGSQKAGAHVGRVVVVGVILGVVALMVNAKTAGEAVFVPFAVAALIALFYAFWLPTITAYRRRHANFQAIFALNFLLGWTLVGWVVAYVWSVANFSFDVPRPSA